MPNLVNCEPERKAFVLPPEKTSAQIIPFPVPSLTVEDARVYGELDEAILNRRIELSYSPNGAKTAPGRWREWKEVRTVRDLLNKFSKHMVGEKDGYALLQGSVIDGERRASAVPFLDLLILDIDVGQQIEDIRARLQELGWFGVIHTSHSHLKPVSDVKKDAVIKWIDEGTDIEPTIEQVKAYLMSEKRYQPWVVEGATIEKTEHTSEGIKIFVRHQPMPKFRVIMVLKERFVIAERKGTQSEAINEWKQRYAGASKLLGAFFDRSCTDPSRLFYLPRHPKGAKEWRIEVVAGGPVDLDQIERVNVRDTGSGGIFEQANDAERGKKDYKTDGLMKFFAKYGRLFDIETFLLEVNPDGDRGQRVRGGRIHRCPNDDAHTRAGDENDKGFYCVNATESENESATAHCSHDACSGLDRVDFVDLICQRAGIGHADGLMKWVPEILKDTAAEKPEKAKRTKAGEDDFGNTLEEFHDTWSYVAEGASGRFVRTLPDGELESKQEGALMRLYEDQSIVLTNEEGKTRRLNPVKQWLADPRFNDGRHTGLKFLPGKTAEEAQPYYNVWRGLAVIPRQGDWSKMRKHIREVLTAGNADDDQFVMGWMAWVLQNLGKVEKKLKVSPVVIGPEGAGKTIVFETFGMILGRNTLSLSKPDQVLGRFNSSLAEALFVMLEEAFFAGDPKINGPLKDLLTGRDMVLERKNIDPQKVPNYAHFVVISNADRPVPIDEGSRRYYPIECSDKKIGMQEEWFDPILQERENGGVAAMAWDLLHWAPPQW